MNTRKSKGQKILAMAVVAMFAFCAFSVCFADHDSDAAYSREYSIDVIDGATFSYSPTFNTNTGTIHVSQVGTILALTGTNDVAKPTVSFAHTFATAECSDAGTPYDTTISAVWTPEEGTEDLKQTATQKITLVAYTKVMLPGSVSINSIAQNKGAGQTVTTITATGPEMTITPTVIGGSGLTATVSGKVVTISTTADIGSITEDQHITVSLTAVDNKHSENKATQTYDFTIYKDLTITCDNYTTFVGKENSHIFDFDLSSEAGTDSVIWAVDNNVTDLPSQITGTMNETNGQYTATLSGATGITYLATEDYHTYKIGATATVKFTGSESTTTYSNYATLKLYKAFEFSVEPSVAGGTIYSASGNPLDVLMSADFVGATKITYNWGDGKSTTVNTNPDAGSKYSARHVYANEGVYVITVTAYNSSGFTNLYTLYDAKNAFFEDITGDTEGDNNNTNTDDNADKSFFEKHGYQFIIFAVIAVLCLVAFFFFGIQNPVVIIAAIITALLAVLCFVYNDIGGLIEQLKAVLKI